MLGLIQLDVTTGVIDVRYEWNVRVDPTLCLFDITTGVITVRY